MQQKTHSDGTGHHGGDDAATGQVLVDHHYGEHQTRQATRTEPAEEQLTGRALTAAGHTHEHWQHPHDRQAENRVNQDLKREVLNALADDSGAENEPRQHCHAFADALACNHQLVSRPFGDVAEKKSASKCRDITTPI